MSELGLVLALVIELVLEDATEAKRTGNLFVVEMSSSNNADINGGTSPANDGPRTSSDAPFPGHYNEQWSTLLNSLNNSNSNSISSDKLFVMRNL